jgi:hypothetical protein
MPSSSTPICSVVFLGPLLNLNVDFRVGIDHCVGEPPVHYHIHKRTMAATRRFPGQVCYCWWLTKSEYEMHAKVAWSCHGINIFPRIEWSSVLMVGSRQRGCGRLSPFPPRGAHNLDRICLRANRPISFGLLHWMKVTPASPLAMSRQSGEPQCANAGNTEGCHASILDGSQKGSKRVVAVRKSCGNA